MLSHTLPTPPLLQVVSADPTYNAKPALMRMLGQLGAKVVKKLSKDVTHVVYERRQAQRASKDHKDSEQDLRELYARVDKLTGVSIVSPSWVRGLSRREMV